MQFRKMGSSDIRVSALGFGCMRLPITSGAADIDENEALRMLHAAIDRGVNYLDTAYVYHGGQSERLVGKALHADDYRNRVQLATKLPCWLAQQYSDFDRLLSEQLSKLQTDHIDFYLLHALNRSSWEAMRALDVFRWAEGAIADGRIRHLGFSFHDTYDVFPLIVDGYDKWTFCQIQYNYMDTENQAGTRGLQYAAARGLGVIVMEPLLGGRLVNPPASIQAIWDAAPTKRSPADWALQWLWNQPEVSLVLSGMSTYSQVEENLASADASGSQHLSEAELQCIEKARAQYRTLYPIPCTKCEYCMPCPNGVNIPRVFQVYNDGYSFDNPTWAREEYRNWVAEKERAVNCITCRECEALCPQKIAISDWMPVVQEVLGEGKPFVSRV
jgi:predicted aldo/keto reductase-like oxidoreductase